MAGSSLVHDKQYTKSGRRDIGQFLDMASLRGVNFQIIGLQPTIFPVVIAK